MILGAGVVTRSTGSITPAFGALDAVAIATGISSLAIVSLVRQRLPKGPGPSGVEAWWQAQLGRAVLLWSVCEIPAIIGAITLFATRHLFGFVVLSGIALAGLFTSRPARLYRGKGL